jgi:hypothetical protein
VWSAAEALQTVGDALEAFTSGEFDDPPPMRWAVMQQLYRPWLHRLFHPTESRKARIQTAAVVQAESEVTPDQSESTT